MANMEEKKNEQLNDNELEDVSGGGTIRAKFTGYCPKCEKTFTGKVICPKCFGELVQKR